MKLLLDTHAFLWWVEGTPALGRRARVEVSNPDNEVFVGIASCWELAVKLSLGKIRRTQSLERSSRNSWRRTALRSLVWNSAMWSESRTCRSIIAIRSIACLWRRRFTTTSRSSLLIAYCGNMA